LEEKRIAARGYREVCLFLLVLVLMLVGMGIGMDSGNCGSLGGFATPNGQRRVQAYQSSF
jgi:hypothetical protein